MIDFKIKRYIKVLPIPEENKTNAYKSMVKKYNALSMDKKAAFENQLNKQLEEYKSE